MAATDQTYRNQYGLDIVFAVSSILMLLSVVWMLIDDYRREFKTEQRIFRDVEMAMAQREALQKTPRKKSFDAAKLEVDKAREQRETDAPKIKELNNEIQKALPEKERADLRLADLKANLDSRTSFYDIASEHAPESANVKRLEDEVKDLQKEIVSARNDVERLTQNVKDLQRQRDALEQPLTKAVGNLKKLLDDFDRQVNLAINKQWGAGDVFRSFFIIDAYGSPTKIEQFTLNDLTIDYNFKGVQRFDRCTTCHKGIARASFTPENLENLLYEPSSELEERLKEAHAILQERKSLLASLDEVTGLKESRTVPDANKLKLTPLSDKVLTHARISEFSAHPRLDLFVGVNSKHPAEKFGCTPCHSGQPSGTGFTFAAHTPNDAKTMHAWQKEHHWEAQHMWDFPMLPKRFVESSCLKCHHQVTDLYSDGNKSEAPKLTKGYDLIREFGCFGCHEINGFSGGRQIGPDLRLEPNPPLEKLTVEQRSKLFADPNNPPGTFRKVAPSLYRVSEKTNESWAVNWITDPRGFRPDTKMPHYYGLSNNDEEALKGTGQEKFPSTEVHGIAHYMFATSRDYVARIAKANDPALAARVAKLEAIPDAKLSDVERKELDDGKALLALRATAQPLDKKLGEINGNAKTGRDLFTKKGCLACHSHASTNEPDDTWPAAPSEADFGPNLSQIKEKLIGKDGDPKKAATWLVNWIKNPTNHNPRTRMPIAIMTDQEIADIAAWLLSQELPADPKTGKISEDLRGPKWATMNVAQPTISDLENLARVYLDRMLAESEIADFFKSKLGVYRVKDLGADERELVDLLEAAKDQKDARRDSLLYYVGKKAIGRLGCYSCHDIPGFDNAKPIGTPLVDWGKKDPTRLAFEDIGNYLNHHYKSKSQIVDKRVDRDGYPLSVAKGPLYEQFFYDALTHKTREGYLHQKLLEPRSYDYERIRAWDDRSRMPQFQFARLKKKLKEEDTEFAQRKAWADAVGMPLDASAKPRPPESSADFAARKEKEEADNREAVMTFVLGLVGDSIPLQYVNQPGPERRAEIKARQVLDKFNCAGCHVLRPGAYEFKLSAVASAASTRCGKKPASIRTISSSPSIAPGTNRHNRAT